VLIRPPIQRESIRGGDGKCRLVAFRLKSLVASDALSLEEQSRLRFGICGSLGRESRWVSGRQPRKGRHDLKESEMDD
jgi:hypothetical protein